MYLGLALEKTERAEEESGKPLAKRSVRSLLEDLSWHSEVRFLNLGQGQD